MVADVDMLGSFSGLFRRDLDLTWVLWLRTFGVFVSFSKKQESIYIKSITKLIAILLASPIPKMFYFKRKNPCLFLPHRKFAHSPCSPSRTTATTAAPKSD